jgi:hypothetical protein
MKTIDGISYFRKPWDYGAGDSGKEGKLIVGDDKLIVLARSRKKIGGPGTVVETAGGLLGGLAVAAAEAATQGGWNSSEYRLEIPKASIKSISALPVGLGLSYQVETAEGADQLDLEPAAVEPLRLALLRHHYPLSAAGWEKKIAAAAALVGLMVLWMLFR